MTDKLRAAAELALECLEELQGGCTDSNDGTVEAITVWCPEVIDALRTALAEQPAEQSNNPVGAVFQEPVAMPSSVRKAAYDQIDRFLRNNLHDDDYADYSAALDSLYTAPQPAKRVPLTDDEIIRAAISTQSAEPGRDGYILPVTFSRAIEAAYEAKNGITGETK